MNRVCAFLLLIIILPFITGLSLLILLIDGWPVFYLQKRVGLNCEEFNIIKFRSMVLNDGSKETSINDSRITTFGRFLRTTSLDELPQLFNILLGHMNFVGPRPDVLEHNYKYTIYEWNKIHTVRPGLTGLAQVFARNTSSLRKRIKFDLIYVERKSFFLDLYIIFKTFGSLKSW